MSTIQTNITRNERLVNEIFDKDGTEFANINSLEFLKSVFSPSDIAKKDKKQFAKEQQDHEKKEEERKTVFEQNKKAKIANYHKSKESHLFEVLESLGIADLLKNHKSLTERVAKLEAKRVRKPRTPKKKV